MISTDMMRVPPVNAEFNSASNEMIRIIVRGEERYSPFGSNSSVPPGTYTDEIDREKDRIISLEGMISSEILRVPPSSAECNSGSIEIIPIIVRGVEKYSPTSSISSAPLRTYTDEINREKYRMISLEKLIK